MSTPSLPSYSHADTPSYTRHPLRDEQTLELNNRAPIPDGPSPYRWTKKSGIATLMLTGLLEAAELPVYGRNMTIEGCVELTTNEGVASVQIKVEGWAKCKTIAEIGRTDIPVLSTTVPLWHQSHSPCPSVLPFKIPLPTTYTLGDETGPLPPTFEYTFCDVQGGTPGLRATIKYSLNVDIEQTHPSLKDRFSSSLSTGLSYLPRSRPANPMSSVPSTNFEAVMEHRVGGKSREVDPIVWQLVLPQPGTYALKQPIPFRVNVSSRSSSLLTPFAPGKKDKASIRVYLLRQVAIKVKRTDLWRSFVIGEGTLTYMPQSLDQGFWLKNLPTSFTKENMVSRESLPSLSGREGWATHEWTGVLNVNSEQVKVGGFTVGGMVVKDFIVLSVVPPNPRLGSLLEVKRVVPIQLTTDTWKDPEEVPIVDHFANQAEANPGTNGFLEGISNGHHVGNHRNGTNGNGLYNGYE